MNLTDEEYRLVAAVAAREGWDDLSRPRTESRAPRSLPEQAAVMRFAAAVPPPRAARGMDPRVARILMLVLGAVGLLACWLVSPERTALGLVVVGLFCLVGMRRRGRRAPGGGVPGLGRRRGAFLRPF